MLVFRSAGIAARLARLTELGFALRGAPADAPGALLQDPAGGVLLLLDADE
jgi:hypothetical protein